MAATQHSTTAATRTLGPLRRALAYLLNGDLPPISRRALAASAIISGAATGTLALAAAFPSDAELLSKAQDALGLQEDLRTCIAAELDASDAGDKATAQRLHRRLDTLQPRAEAATAAVLAMPATTLPGLQAKARVALAMAQPAGEGAEDSPEGAALAALAGNLLSLRGGAL